MTDQAQMDEQARMTGMEWATQRGMGALAQKMGIEFTEFSVERSVGTMPVEGNTQPVGLLHGGAYAIVLSRRINGPDGHFAGVVTGSIRFSYFHELVSRLSLSAQDTITVFRKDGMVIMRTPFDLDVIGRNLNYTPGIGRVLQQPTGSLSSAHSPDGVNRLYVWRGGAGPLVVLVGKPWADIIGLWQKEALQIGIIMLGLIALVVAGTLFVVREIRQRAAAEEKLEELATTDALTGLRNRRKFDAVIDAFRLAVPKMLN